MKRWIGILGMAAVLGLGMVTAEIVPAEAATVTSSASVGPHGITESRTVHFRHGRRTVRKFYGRHGRVCRSVVRVRHTPHGTVRSVRSVCR